MPLLGVTKVVNPEDLYRLLRPLVQFPQEKEQGFVVYLSQDYIAVYYDAIEGKEHSVTFDGIRIANFAKKFGYTRVLIAHTHPNGSIELSQEDRDCTIIARDEMAMRDITLLDSLVFSAYGYSTFRAPYPVWVRG